MIETVTYWDEGFGKWNWVVWKNVLVTIFGVGALVFGTQSAIKDILELYSSPSNATTTTAEFLLTNFTATTTLSSI